MKTNDLTNSVVKVGRKMIELASSGKVKDDVLFNNLCRIGDELVHFRTPFNKRKLKDFSSSDRDFINQFLYHEPKNN